MSNTPLPDDVIEAAVVAHQTAYAQNYLPMWVVYDHPTDEPNKFVARMHVAGAKGGGPTGNRMLSDKVEDLRSVFEEVLGLVPLARDLNDDPVIMEVWL